MTHTHTIKINFQTILVIFALLVIVAAIVLGVVFGIKDKLPGILVRVSPTETKLFTDLNTETTLTVANMRAFMTKNNITMLTGTTNSDILDIFLPEVTSVGELAINSYIGLVSVSLPKATTFGDDAFEFCLRLNETGNTVFASTITFTGAGGLGDNVGTSLGRTAATFGNGRILFN